MVNGNGKQVGGEIIKKSKNGLINIQASNASDLHFGEYQS